MGAVVGAGSGRVRAGLALPSHQRRVLLLRLSAHAALYRRAGGPRDHRRRPQSTSAFRFRLPARLFSPEPLLSTRLSSSGNSNKCCGLHTLPKHGMDFSQFKPQLLLQNVGPTIL